MFAIGSKGNPKEKVLYEPTKRKEMNPVLNNVCWMTRSYLELCFPEILHQILQCEREAGIVPHELMGGTGGVSSCMVVSVNLGNASHYDNGDLSHGVAIWTELKPGMAKNWYFILPNVLIPNSNGRCGVAIKLHHGCAISWDGRYIRHCSSVPQQVGGKTGNTVFGHFWAAKQNILKKY